MDDLQYRKMDSIIGWSIVVLNLVINGWPSILEEAQPDGSVVKKVLNLVINGWPSILEEAQPDGSVVKKVLNLVINGWPSILKSKSQVDLFDFIVF